MKVSYLELSETELIEIIEKEQLAFLWRTIRTKQIENIDDCETDGTLNINLNLCQIEEDSKKDN